MPDGREPEAPALPQGPQAVRPPVPVLDAYDRAGETPYSLARFLRPATSAGRAHAIVRLDWRRKAHEERKCDQDGDEKAAQNAACAISSKHESHRQFGGLARPGPSSSEDGRVGN